MAAASTSRKRFPPTLWVAPALLALAFGAAGCERTEAARGAVLYSQHCARCHGAEGVGQNPARPWGSLDPAQEGFVAPSLDGRGHCWEHTREELAAIIRRGGSVPGSPMLPAPPELSRGDIDALLDYVGTLWPRAMQRLNRQLVSSGNPAPAARP